MRTKHLFINTMGCQMNVYDTGQIQNRLAPLGYLPTEELEKADMIIVNTCSIRDKAEQKAFSFLGRLAPLKQRNPDLIVGIGGCVAQQEGRRILKRMPFVDLVFGTHAIGRLPGIVQRIIEKRCRVVDVEISETISPDDYLLDGYPQTDTSAFVTIMRGCDNYCTYCVVPYVRGRESSRAPEEIVAEIEHLVSKGVREVTLLGQNVNSYGLKEGRGGFVRLLKAVNSLEGLARIRFTTSHPKDLSPELMACFQQLDKLCHHIHLPVQSGSDAVLKRMNRRYTRKAYLEKVEQLRALNSDLAITSDIIVGFPGETDEDFEETLSLIRQVEYDGLFAFIYSDRPNAPAVKFSDKLDDTIKKERLQQVLTTQEVFTLKKHNALVGAVQEILVDGLHRSNGDQEEIRDKTALNPEWSGRTSTNKIVHFARNDSTQSDNQMLTGKIVRIMIEKALPHCLLGRQVSSEEASDASGKGDRTHVA
ncbi:MAG: tRNA (N6-isopentenyl adenosine(37)-C2)-methylthiotransferase MiaB [Desulfobacteraceae bacterium]